MKPFQPFSFPCPHFLVQFCIGLSSLFCLTVVGLAAEPEVRFPEQHFDFIDTYCLSCHDADTEKGKVNLEDLSFHITTIEQAERWQKVLNSINAREMPPEDKKQPQGEEKADFLADLADTMVLARKSLSDSGGNITMRRLNRREYQNTIEHLLGIKVDVSNLPSEGGSGTFDSEGASQFMSSDQIEQYLKLGRSAIDELFERQAAMGQETKTFRVEPETTVNVKHLEIIKQQEDRYRLLAPWMAAVDKAVKAPENETIMAQLRKEHPDIDQHPYRIYRMSNQLTGVPDPKDLGLGDADSAMIFYQLDYNTSYKSLKVYSELPHNDRGTYLRTTEKIVRLDIIPPAKDLPPGTYRLRVRAGIVEGSLPERHFIEVGHPQRRNQVPSGFAGYPLSSHQVTGTIDQPQIIETMVEVGVNPPKEFGIQERQSGSFKDRRDIHHRFKRENGHGTPPAIWVDWIELEGPIKDAELTQSKVHRIEPEETINPANEKEIAKIEDEYERFTRWQKGVDEAVKTPANQAKIAEFRRNKERNIDHPFWFYGFADRLEGTPNAMDFGFGDSKKAAASHPENDRRNLAYHKHYAALPHRDRGTYLKVAHGTGRIIVAPEELPPGNYTLRVRAGKVEGSPASRHFIEVGHPQREIAIRNWGLEGRPISSHQVNGTIAHPETIEIPLVVGTKTIREFAIQEKQPNNGNLKALWDAHNAHKKENGYGHPPAIWIDWVELEGPHDPSAPKRWKQRREVELHANVKVRGTYNGYFKGGSEKAKAFLETGKPQKGITDEQEAKFRMRAFEENGPTYRRYLDHPLTRTGSFLTISNANKEEYIALPPEHPSDWQKSKHVVESLPPGDYKIRFRIGAVTGTPAERHFVDLGTVPGAQQFNHVQTLQVTGTTDQPQTIEVPVRLTKDGPRKFALREKRNPKADNARTKAARKETGVAPDPALWIDWVEWEGPFHAPSDDTSFSEWWVAAPAASDEYTRALTILKLFAFKAFRGVEAEGEFIDRLANIYEARRKAGDAFDTAIRLPLSIILASPGFLYFNEPRDGAIPRSLNDRELAVRLAYFLWSAPPDAELLELALTNELHQPDVLRQQVDRLIADARSDEFVSGFVHQWLDMERLDFFQFDTTLHRAFDESTRAASRREVYESFAYLLRDSEAGQLGKLLNSDYVFINGLLGTYYGIEGVTGDQFQKVALPVGSPRGGLLGMAAIHAMGSDGIESSPVERGAWVLRHLLHDPPPPAPANVPQLSRLADQPLTTREKLAAHMEEPQCASCHRNIDPVGFGLENFDAAGKWRTEEGNGKRAHKIDPAGAFHNGPKFADYFELRDLIADREDDFALGFTEHLIAYALGRPFGFTDVDLANEIVMTAKDKSFAVSEFVHALVQSDAFKTK